MRTATTAQITTDGGMSMTPKVLVAGRRQVDQPLGRGTRERPARLHLDQAERDRAHRQRHDQRLDREAVADRSRRSPPRIAAPTTRDQRARRPNEMPYLSLEHGDDQSAPATMKPATERSNPPIRISSVWPTEASPASDASTRIGLMLVQFQNPSVDRAVGEDGDQRERSAGSGSGPAEPTSLRQTECDAARGGVALRPVTSRSRRRRPWLDPPTPAQDRPRRSACRRTSTCSQLGLTCSVMQQVPEQVDARPRRAASRSGRRGRPTATCRRARPRRSPAACTSGPGSAFAELRRAPISARPPTAGEQAAERVAATRTARHVDAAGERRRVVGADRVERRRYGIRPSRHPDQRAGSRS